MHSFVVYIHMRFKVDRNNSETQFRLYKKSRAVMQRKFKNANNLARPPENALFAFRIRNTWLII